MRIDTDMPEQDEYDMEEEQGYEEKEHYEEKHTKDYGDYMNYKFDIKNDNYDTPIRMPDFELSFRPNLGKKIKGPKDIIRKGTSKKPRDIIGSGIRKYKGFSY